MDTATTSPPAIRPSATDCATATALTTNRMRQANSVSGNKPIAFAITRQTVRTSCHGIVQNSTAMSNLVWPRRIRPTAAATTAAAWSAGSWPNWAARRRPAETTTLRRPAAPALIPTSPSRA